MLGDFMGRLEKTGRCFCFPEPELIDNKPMMGWVGVFSFRETQLAKGAERGLAKGVPSLHLSSTNQPYHHCLVNVASTKKKKCLLQRL